MAIYACQLFGAWAMWWFDKGKRREVWDEEIPWPIGDIEAAHRIREICRSAADSALKMAGAADRSDKQKTYETKGSAKHPRVDKVLAAMALAKQRRPDLVIDGELQGDAALIPSVGERKAKGSPVAGK